MNNTKEYTCTICGETFEKGWSDKKALQEANQIWGKIPKEERVVICDDCFNQRTGQEVKEMGKEYKGK